MTLYKRISPGDWALILGTAGGFGLTMVSAIFWISNLDSRVIQLAQAQSIGHAERVQHEDRIFNELTLIHEQLGRIEGNQRR